MRATRSNLLLLLLGGSLVGTAAAGGSGNNGGYLNVYGNALQSCSSDGTALTGYTRTGYCVDRNDDSGSHHICIDMSSTSDGSGNNFCLVTGQDDWCSSTDMPCHGGSGGSGEDGSSSSSSSSSCPIVQWCVCQWAFASYIETAGGCQSIQSLYCDAINVQAVWAYQAQAAAAGSSSSSNKYQDALECIASRCGLDLNSLPGSGQALFANSGVAPFATLSSSSKTGWMISGLFVAAAAVGAIFFSSRKNLPPMTAGKASSGPSSTDLLDEEGKVH